MYTSRLHSDYDYQIANQFTKYRAPIALVSMVHFSQQQIKKNKNKKIVIAHTKSAQICFIVFQFGSAPRLCQLANCKSSMCSFLLLLLLLLMSHTLFKQLSFCAIC